VSWPVHDTARVTEAFRRAVLRLFVRLDLFDEDQAAGMLTWPHSGFHVHTAVWIPEDDRTFATRLARYCARNPVALERLTYDRTATAVTYRSDKSEGPTAGTEIADPLELTGNTRMRWLLVEAGWRILRSTHPDAAGLKAWGEAVAARRGKRVAVVALARKLAGILFAMWRDNTPYRAARPQATEVAA